ASVKLDGAAAAAPTISGTTVTFTPGTLTPGAHALQGVLVDEAGTRGAFRVGFTVPDSSAADPPPVEKNTTQVAGTTLTASDQSVTVTVPASAYTAPMTSLGSDWLVLRVDPSAPATNPPTGFKA